MRRPSLEVVLTGTSGFSHRGGGSVGGRELPHPVVECLLLRFHRVLVLGPLEERFVLVAEEVNVNEGLTEG